MIPLTQTSPLQTAPAAQTAEALLAQLQRALLGAAGDDPADEPGGSREALRAAERAYGAQATRCGRLLHDLLSGSHAWDLVPPPAGSRARARGLPRVHELCACEPVLRAMRESGELAERERLLRARDAALAALWRDDSATEGARWLDAEAVHDDYFAATGRTAEAYRAHYEALARAASGAAAPLAGPRVRSRPLLQPPLMALLFRACHQDAEEAEYRHGGSVVGLAPAPLAWTGGEWSGPERLDPMAWDLAALAVSAFFVRTEGGDADASFPLLIDDYFGWRGTDPRKRSPRLRAQIAARLELLCSDRVQVRSAADLWRTDPQTGRRRKTPVVAEGPFLVKRARIGRRPGPDGEADPDPAGYLLSLGEWARAFVAERAMLGVHLRRLAEYDQGRQGWERRIGWYLAFQMTNQASRMTFQDVVKDGKARTLVTPQHPLKMRTVLENSHVPWAETARTNPGKVIRQWGDALETLRRDGILGPCPCLDGAADGSDLPARGRLAAMLERRYQFVPGRDLLPPLRAKRGAADRARRQ